MKKLMIPFITFLYLMQIAFVVGFCLIAAGGETADGEFAYRADIVLWLALAFGGVAAVLGFVNIVLAITSIFKPFPPEQSVYKTTMALKIALIPYFIISFIICCILVVGFLNPFLGIFLIIVLPLMILITYMTMIVSSSYNLAYMFLKIKNGEGDRLTLIVHIILHIVFVADVVSSIILALKSKNENVI